MSRREEAVGCVSRGRTHTRRLWCVSDALPASFTKERPLLQIKISNPRHQKAA